MVIRTTATASSRVIGSPADLRSHNPAIISPVAISIRPTRDGAIAPAKIEAGLTAGGGKKSIAPWRTAEFWPPPSRGRAACGGKRTDRIFMGSMGVGRRAASPARSHGGEVPRGEVSTRGQGGGLWIFILHFHIKLVAIIGYKL